MPCDVKGVVDTGLGVAGIVIALLQEIRTIAQEMGEYEPVCNLLCDRFDILKNSLDGQPDGLVRDLLDEHKLEVEKFRNALFKFKDYNTFRRLWSHRKIMATIGNVTDRISAFEGKVSIVGIVIMDRNRHMVSEIKELVKAGVADILRAQERTASDTRAIRNEVRQGKLAESTTMICYELDHKGSELPPGHIANLKRAYSGIEDIAHPPRPTFPKWFISPNDIDYEDEDQFARGEFGQVHHGTWTGGAEVVIKVLLADDATARRLFKQELDVWYSLDHPHINHLFGACDLVSPPFFVSEVARNGDFVRYFREVGRAEIWRLFYEAALGLEYLHNNKVIHGDLKCSNLLVGSDNNAKICDFGFSYVRTASVGMSAKAQAKAIRYKAPETMIQSDNPDDYNPRRASDVYSFGLCIWEAFEGEAPFGLIDEDKITEKLFDKNFKFDPPKNLPDKQWEFVKRMLHHNWKKRVSLDVVVDKLREYKLAEAELATARVCSGCNASRPFGDKFCSNCGFNIANPPAVMSA